MAVRNMNHAVLYVSDVARTTEFYTQALGFRVVTSFPGAAFLQAPASTNDHDLGIFEMGKGALPSEAGRRTVGLYHLAWEVETLGDLEQLAKVLAERNALVGASDHGTTKSLYAKDPDGLEFEVVWLIPAHLITEDDLQRKATTTRLNLDAEIERFGREEISGAGISHGGYAIAATNSPTTNPLPSNSPNTNSLTSNSLTSNSLKGTPS